MIQEAIYHRKLACFVEYIRVHSSLPGPLAADNAVAEKLTKIIALSQIELSQQ